MEIDPRTDRHALEAELEARGCHIKGNTVTCPWHDDSNASAGIIQGHDAHWRVNCLKCTRRANVLDLRAEASGRDVADLLRELPSDRATASIKVKEPPRILASKDEVARVAGDSVQAWHVYGPKAAPVLVIARISLGEGKKKFQQFTPQANGTYAIGNLIPRGQIPLYRVDELPADGPVLVVEGEKCADACWSVGIPAVTSAMGAKSWASSDWSTLRGRTVILWPDNDQDGRAYTESVKSVLNGLGSSVSVIDPDDLDLPPKGDVSDIIERLAGKSKAEMGDIIRTIMTTAPVIDPAASLGQWIDDVAAGRWVTLDWPLDMCGSLSRSCMPGSLSLLCADPGAGKSWLALQLAQYWHSQGHQVAVRMLEDDLRTHLGRLLAQLDGQSNLTSDEWVRLHVVDAREAYERHRPALADAGRWITAHDEKPPKLGELCDWVERQCRAGARVVLVDPITATEPDAKPWAADFTAAMRLKLIAHQTGASIILTTHPRGMQQKSPSLSSMAGGSSWPRFCHSAFWLERVDMSELRSNGGNNITCNRVMTIIKCRHGRGSGMRVGMIFDQDTVRFREVDILAPEDSDAWKPKRQTKKSDEALTAKERSSRTSSSPSDSEQVF